MGVPEPISIHAPLTGCDLRSAHQDSGTSYFNPRTPCGVRRGVRLRHRTGSRISIHAPLAGCNGQAGHAAGRHRHISIHAPLTGCDSPPGKQKRRNPHFNPRTPRGVRLREQNFLRFLVSFQSTHPSRGATKTDENNRNNESISIHAPLAGCDRLQRHQGH